MSADRADSNTCAAARRVGAPALVGGGLRTGLTRHAVGWVAALAAVLPGCAFGPRAIEKTHGRYAASVQRVEEEQFLKNIVRLRYTEAPRNLEVAAIATQYEMSAGAEARPFFSTEATGDLFRSFRSVLPFAAVGGANRPTVSLDPQDDGTAVRQFLTPITADTLVFLTQSGWPVEGVLRVWVDRLNGVPNWVSPGGPTRDTPTDFARFRRAAELLQAGQDRELATVRAVERTTELSGPLPAEAVTAAAAVEAAKAGYEYRPRADGKTWALLKREQRLVVQIHPAGRGSPELVELAALLNLRADQDQLEIVVASGVPDPAKNPSEPVAALRLTPRSTAHALFFLANGVAVPAEHVAGGLVRVPADGTDPTAATDGVFRVHSCRGRPHAPPACAYVSVYYRDHWFYVDDRDHESKATLLLMLQLRKLDFRRQQIGTVPALTLPVGR